jgi:hypothetical protein
MILNIEQVTNNEKCLKSVSQELGEIKESREHIMIHRSST